MAITTWRLPKGVVSLKGAFLLEENGVGGPFRPHVSSGRVVPRFPPPPSSSGAKDSMCLALAVQGETNYWAAHTAAENRAYAQ